VTRKNDGWQAVITCHGKAHYLGFWPDDQEAEAARAYDKKAIELFGPEYAVVNFPTEVAA
jgi:hypothetical protein